MSSAFFDPDATAHCSMDTYYAVKGVQSVTDSGPVWAATDILRLMGCQKLSLTDPNKSVGKGLLQQSRCVLINSGFGDTRRDNGDLVLTYAHMSAIIPLIRHTNRSTINEVVEAMRRLDGAGVTIPRLVIAPDPVEPKSPEPAPSETSTTSTVADLFDIPEGTPAHENTRPVSEVFHVDEESGVQFERVFHLGKMWVTAAPLCKLVKSSSPSAMLRKLRRTVLPDASFNQFAVLSGDQYKTPYWCDKDTAAVIVTNFGGENTDHIRALLAKGFDVPTRRPQAEPTQGAATDEVATAAIDLFSDALSEVTDDLTSRIDSLAKRVDSLTSQSGTSVQVADTVKEEMRSIRKEVHSKAEESVEKYLNGRFRSQRAQIVNAAREEMQREEDDRVARLINDSVSDAMKALHQSVAEKMDTRLAIQGSNHLNRVKESLPGLVSKATSEHVRKQVHAMMKGQLAAASEERLTEAVKSAMSEFQFSTLSQVESRFESMREQLMQESRDERAAFMGTVERVLVDALGTDMAEEVTTAITRAQLTGAELRDRIRELAHNEHERELLNVLSKNSDPMSEADIPSKLKGKSRKSMHTTLHVLEQRGVIHRDSSKRWVFQAV